VGKEHVHEWREKRQQKGQMKTFRFQNIVSIYIILKTVTPHPSS